MFKAIQEYLSFAFWLYIIAICVGLTALISLSKVGFSIAGLLLVLHIAGM